MSDMNRELDWNDEIKEESSFVLLPEGDYLFEVESFERGRSKGTANVPASKMAILKIKILSDLGQCQITYNLILHSKLEWKLSEFFMSIGQKKKGEPLKMNWQFVTGARGKCHVCQEPYNGNVYNKISKFLVPGEEKPSFTSGKF